MNHRHISPDQKIKRTSHSPEKLQKKMRQTGSTNKLLFSKMHNQLADEELTIGNFTYKKSDQIGSGYSSKVYKATSTTNKGFYAIKVIELRKYSSSSLELLDNQIEILKKLDHPNVIKLYSVFRTPSNCYIVTQYCKHGDLLHYISKKGKLSEKSASDIMTEIVDGIKYLFKMGIIHRDIKPANILCGQKTWKIADFGFAIQSKEQIKTKQNVGTPLYMPLESLIKNLYAPESDIFSIGIMYYELLVGQTPWECRSEKELIKKLSTVPFNINEKYKMSAHIKYLLYKLCSVDKKQRMTKEEFCELNLKNFISLTNFNQPQKLTKVSKLSVDKQEGSKQKDRKVSGSKRKSKSKTKETTKSKQKEKNNLKIKVASKQYKIICKSKKKSQVITNSQSKSKKKISQQQSQTIPSTKVYNTKTNSEQHMEENLSFDRFQIINYNILLNELNYCRFMYYMVENTAYFLLEGNNKKKFQLILFKHVLKLIKMLADSKQNFFGLPNWDSFRQSQKYLTLLSTLQQYCQKYEKQYLNYLKESQINTIKDINQNLPQLGSSDSFSITFYKKLKSFLVPLLKQATKEHTRIDFSQDKAKVESIRAMHNYYKSIDMRIKQYQNEVYFERYGKIQVVKNYKNSDVTKQQLIAINEQVSSF